MKTAAGLNAEKIEAIIKPLRGPDGVSSREIARKIVEALPVLRPAQQSMDERGRSKTIAAPLPWKSWVAPVKPAPHAWGGGWSG